MASDKVNRLQSLMQNQDLKDNHVEETPVKETLAEADPFGVAPVDWGTEGYSVRDLSLSYLSGASDSSDSEYAVRRTVPENQKKKKKYKRSRPLADMVDQDEQKRSLGDTPPLGMGFVPILAVAKYPYKFMTASPTIVDNVSKGFFAAEKFWGRKWTL